MKRTLTRVIPLGGVMLVMCVALSGCFGIGLSPNQDVFTVPPSHTAILVPMANTKGQATFQSQEYYLHHEVAARQVVINYHSVTTNGNVNWYPNFMLIEVNRQPVTRNWTSTASTGTDKANQAFMARSSDGTQFSLESSCTAGIDQNDVPAYLYNFSASPGSTLENAPGSSSGHNPDFMDVNSLPYVMDNNVWGAIQDNVSQLFGAQSFEQDLADSGHLFAQAIAPVIREFKAKGVTITACGLRGGINPVNPGVEAALNNAVAQQSAKLAAQAQATAQAVRNINDVAIAAAQATAQTVKNNAQLNFIQREGQLTAQYPGLAQYVYASRSNGQGPSVIVGSGAGVMPTIPLPVPTAKH